MINNESKCSKNASEFIDVSWKDHEGPTIAVFFLFAPTMAQLFEFFFWYFYICWAQCTDVLPSKMLSPRGPCAPPQWPEETQAHVCPNLNEHQMPHGTACCNFCLYKSQLASGGEGRGGGLNSTPAAPQWSKAVLAQPLNNIGPTKELIKPIFGQEAVAYFSRWPHYLWFSGTLTTKELHVILL